MSSNFTGFCKVFIFLNHEYYWTNIDDTTTSPAQLLENDLALLVDVNLQKMTKYINGEIER